MLNAQVEYCMDDSYSFSYVETMFNMFVKSGHSLHDPFGAPDACHLPPCKNMSEA